MRTAKTIWAGRILTALPAAFLLFDGTIKLLRVPAVAEAFTRLGYPETLAVGIGLLELACVVVYVNPGTSRLGAVLLTGFLGGAIATHVRVGDPLFSHVLFPTYLGAMIWAGLWFRDEPTRAFFSPGTPACVGLRTHVS
jgi:hypothetical protein